MKNMRDRIRYQWDEFVCKGTVSLILSLFSVLAVMGIVVGLLGNLISGNHKLGKEVWNAYMQIMDPGNLSSVDGKFGYYALMTFATLFGILITGLFISLIMNGFQSKLENLNKGRTKIVEKNHTLILGWDESIYVLIEELIEANKNVNNPRIVILSDESVIDMSNKVRNIIQNAYNTKIIYRTGSIHRVDDLHMCCINSAKSVIVLGNDISTIKTLVVIASSGFFDTEGHVSTVLREKSNISIAKSIGKNKVYPIHTREAIIRIIAQTCIQPGLSFIYDELFDFIGDEIYFFSNAKLVGKSFRQAQFMLMKSIVIGVVSDGDITIHPANDYMIKSDDELIVISEDDDKSYIDDTHIKIYEPLIAGSQDAVYNRVLNISIIGFNSRTLEIISELDSYLDKGSQINMLVCCEKFAQEVKKYESCVNNCSINTFIGKTYKKEAVKQVVNDSTDGIIILYHNGDDCVDCDSRTMISLLHIKDLERERNTSYHVVSEISEHENAPLVDLIKSDDFVISELFTNKMLSQVAENRHLLQAFECLMTSEGSEIYLKAPEDYVVLHEKLNFYTVVEAAARHNSIAVGYVKADKSGAKNIVLNPKKDELFSLAKGDYIIVLAEN